MKKLKKYSTKGEVKDPNFVGPVLPKTPQYNNQFIAPSLAFQNQVKEFVKQEDIKKKTPAPVKKYIPFVPPVDKNVTQSDNARITKVAPKSQYTSEELDYFKDNNIRKEFYPYYKKQLDIWKEGDKQEAANIVQRRKDVQQKAIKDLEEGNFTTARAENLTNAFRLFPGEANSFIDDYLNPFQMVGSMAGNLGSHFAQDAGPINPWALALDIASPLAVGRLAGLGSPNTKQFVNNIVNPVAGFNPFESLTKKAKRGLLNFIDRRLGEDTPVFQFKKQIGRDVDPGDIRTVVETNKKQVLNDPSGFTRAIGSGAEEFESVIQSRLNDLTSEEGYKRLVNQEKEYLKSINYNGNVPLDEQAAINAGARINELTNITVVNRLAKDFFKTNHMKGEGLDKIIDKKLLYNNAYYGPPNVSDDLYKPSGYKPTFGINLEKFPQLGGKIIPGELGIGYTNLGNVPIMHHEIAHALQRNRTLPIDTELSFITPRSNLNSTDAAAYKYFMNGSKGHEPSAFANELRASMLQRGLIKNIYDPITPELLQKAHTSFMQKPIARYQKLGKTTPGGFLTGHRIIDFMEPSMSNFNTLSELMNKLPAAAPLGIGLGAALYNSGNPANIQQYANGGPYQPETSTNWVEPKYVAGTNKDGHTGYDGVDTIYYDPNSEWENINNPQWLEHEKYHHFQNLNGRSHVGNSMQRPGPNASNEEMAAYYNRRDFDLQNSMNNMVNQSPELQFVPQEILQRGVYQNQNHIPGYEDLMYQDPNTLEGEARQYEDYIGAGNKSIFTPQYSKGGDIKNKAKLNAVINKMAVDNFDWNSKSLPEVQQYLNTIKSPEIKAIVKELNLLNPKNLSSILGVQNNPMNTMLDYGY